MKNYLTTITLLFGLSLSAQTFDRVFNHPGDDYASYQIVEHESHYFFNILYKENEQFRAALYHLDEKGDVVDSLILNEYYRLPILLNNYIYLFNFRKTDSIGILKINLTDLSIVNKKGVDPKIDWNFIHSSNYFDYCNCFTLSGRAVDSNGYRNSAILQLDTHLNITKENYIRLLLGPFLDSSLIGNYGSIYRVMENPKGNGMWLLGYPMDTVPNMQGYTAGVTPLDSNLIRDSINHSLLRSNIQVEGGNSTYTWSITTEPYSGIRLTDTSYLFAGRASTDRYREDFQLWWYEDDMAFVITDDSLNDVRWEFWGGVDSTEISTAGSGVSKHPNHNHVYIAYTSNFRFSAGMSYPYTLMKLDLEGNELWVKHYSIPWSYLVNSVLATSDGGAIMVGTMIDTNTIEKDVWVVKVDRWGNLNTTGINEVKGKIDASNYIVYPNPAKNQLNLLKVNQFKPYEFELYDTFGRLVKTVSWREDHQIIDISSIASGIYVYRIINQEGNVGSGKLVVE